MYALQRQDGMTWGEFSQEEAQNLAQIYQGSGASDVAVKIQPTWTKRVQGDSIYWIRPSH